MIMFDIMPSLFPEGTNFIVTLIVKCVHRSYVYVYTNGTPSIVHIGTLILGKLIATSRDVRPKGGLF